MDYAKHMVSTPQTEALPGQVANSAGGFSFAVDDWTRLDRFLVLGSEGGSYYATERKLTLENAAAVQRCIASDGPRAVARIKAISDTGRAPKNDPALFALALAAKRGNDVTRRAAFEVLPTVARIGTHMLHFASYVESLGGWGRATTRAFGRWYTDMEPSRLALQLVKYQQRDGWSHRDVLRKSHPKTAGLHQELLRWAVKGWDGVGDQPHPEESLRLVWAFEKAKTARGRELVKLISEYGLPHECVPNEAKDDPVVWEAILPHMGMTALVRNLGKMTSVGLLAPMSSAVQYVVGKLADVDEIRRARLHPLQILVALKTYAQSHGARGSLTWSTVGQVVDALDGAFYSSFKAQEATGKRHLLALDVSGSMGGPEIAGMSGITPRVGSAAMALVTAAVEPVHHFMAFGHTFHPLNLTPRMRLDDATSAVSGLPFGGTDCALPMVWAQANRVPVDVFCVYTDSETWAGNIHPNVALASYRQKMGIAAKLVVIGMVSNGFTIADPTDGGMMDVVGFDTATPSVIADFACHG